MKKLFLLFVFCCFASVASAQSVEIVYLKDGGKIRGIITEQTPNQTLQIQTADGKVVICAYDAIKKIETTDEKVVIGTYGTIEKNTNGLPEQNLNTASFRPHYEESVASAQFIEVVHLKNGGMIRGTITEQIPNQSLKIQTADGSVFVYSFDEIEKITKEAPSRYGTSNGFYRRSFQESQKPRYQGSVDFGYSVGVGILESSRVELSTSHGCLINPYFYVGAGLGVHYHYDASAVAIPIFADFRGNFMKGNIKPFLNFRIGYSFGDFEGLYLAPSVGVSINRFDIGLGYSLQKMTFDSYYWDESINLGAVTFKFGIRF